MRRSPLLPLLALALAGCPAASSAGTAPASATGRAAGPATGSYVHSPYDQPPPPDARAVVPALPQRIRLCALSSDRRRIAYTQEGLDPAPLVVATFGGTDAAIGQVAAAAVSQLQWSHDGAAILYLDEDAGRLMRQPVAGGAPEALAALPRGAYVLASPARAEVYYLAGGLHRLDLGSGARTELVQGPDVERFSVSPDGRHLEVVTADRREGGAAAVRVVDLATGAIRTLAPRPDGALSWLPDASALVALGFDPAGGGMVVQRLPLAGAIPPPVRHALAAGLGIGKLQPELLSPDGRRVAAYAGDRNLVVDLERGTATVLPSFGYVRAWLDDRTLMGEYHGGQYAVPAGAPAPPLPSPTPPAACPEGAALRIAGSAMAAAVGGTITLRAQQAFDGRPVADAAWRLDPSTPAAARLEPAANGSCRVAILAAGPVRVLAAKGACENVITLAGVAAPAPGEPLDVPALGLMASGLWRCCDVPAGVTLIRSDAEWAGFRARLVAGRRPPDPLPPAPVDFAAASLVAIGASYGYPTVPPVLTRAEPGGGGLVEVVQTRQDFLAPPPATGRAFLQLHRVAKLPAGTAVRVVCDEPACAVAATPAP